MWATKHGTDTIPSGALGSLMDWAMVGMSWMDAADACLRVGLFEHVQGGWKLTDYHLALAGVR